MAESNGGEGWQDRELLIGSDHGGFALKKDIIEYLEKRSVPFKDIGCHSTDSVDYPDVALDLAREVSTGHRGILICGTGIGMSIAANKVQGVHAALCHNEFTAEMSRKHNNANILVLGGKILDYEWARKMVTIWLETDFEGDRHKRRVDKIHTYEVRS